jgi:dephospho-CoA kinase
MTTDESKAQNIIFAYCGECESGKNTSAEYIRTMRGIDGKEFAFAEPLKNIVAAASACDVADLYNTKKKAETNAFFGISNRKCLQKFGDLFRTKLGEDSDFAKFADGSFFTQHMQFRLDEYFSNVVTSPRVAHVTDMRFLNEYNVLKKNSAWKVYVIKLYRPRATTTTAAKHVSETEYEKIPADFIVKNDGSLKDLYAKLDAIVAQIKK